MPLRAESSRRRRENSDARSDRTPTADTESTAEKTADSAFMRKALLSLPASEREPIHLAFFVGMTYREAAAHLNLAEGTVKSRIRSGLRRLRVSNEMQLHHAGGDSELGLVADSDFR